MPKPQKALKQKGAWLLRGWKWVFNFYSAAILLFLIVPVLVIVPLSFNAGSFLSYPMAGFHCVGIRPFSTRMSGWGPWVTAC